jgi:hypothetical protein
MTKTNRIRKKPFWERGYEGQGYWLGKQRLGAVKLGPKGAPNGIYHWEAGNHAGHAQTLKEAKRMVEQVVLVGASQLSLF